jgi:sugar phosphate isomerase/epimerase
MSAMHLRLFGSLWAHEGDWEWLFQSCERGRFGGIEAPPPEEPQARHELRARLEAAGAAFIAEICTAGSYVPRREAGLEEHLQSFQEGLGRATECNALFVTSMAGCDAWSVEQSVQFFGAAHEMARQHGIAASFETHRGRSFFNPWTTRDVLQQLPDLRLTCDFSHWCVVCERLVDSEAQVLAMCFERAHHVHARVGYEQGPQVPDPSAPEYAAALHAHERWWSAIWEAHRQQGRAFTTMTPEFGPDKYLQQLPHTQMPVADLKVVNAWMADRQRARFAAQDPRLKL